MNDYINVGCELNRKDVLNLLFRFFFIFLYISVKFKMFNMVLSDFFECTVNNVALFTIKTIAKLVNIHCKKTVNLQNCSVIFDRFSM